MQCHIRYVQNAVKWILENITHYYVDEENKIAYINEIKSLDIPPKYMEFAIYMLLREEEYIGIEGEIIENATRVNTPKDLKYLSSDFTRFKTIMVEFNDSTEEDINLVQALDNGLTRNIIKYLDDQVKSIHILASLKAYQQEWQTKTKDFIEEDLKKHKTQKNNILRNLFSSEADLDFTTKRQSLEKLKEMLPHLPSSSGRLGIVLDQLKSCRINDAIQALKQEELETIKLVFTCISKCHSVKNMDFYKAFFKELGSMQNELLDTLLQDYIGIDDEDDIIEQYDYDDEDDIKEIVKLQGLLKFLREAQKSIIGSYLDGCQRVEKRALEPEKQGDSKCPRIEEQELQGCAKEYGDLMDL